MCHIFTMESMGKGSLMSQFELFAYSGPSLKGHSRKDIPL